MGWMDTIWVELRRATEKRGERETRAEQEWIQKGGAIGSRGKGRLTSRLQSSLGSVEFILEALGSHRRF